MGHGDQHAARIVARLEGLEVLDDDRDLARGQRLDLAVLVSDVGFRELEERPIITD